MLAVPDSALAVFVVVEADSLSDSDFEQADRKITLIKNSNAVFVKFIFGAFGVLLFLSIIGAKGKSYC